MKSNNYHLFVQSGDGKIRGQSVSG